MVLGLFLASFISQSVKDFNTIYYSAHFDKFCVVILREKNLKKNTEDKVHTPTFSNRGTKNLIITLR